MKTQVETKYIFDRKDILKAIWKHYVDTLGALEGMSEKNITFECDFGSDFADEDANFKAILTIRK